MKNRECRESVQKKKSLLQGQNYSYTLDDIAGLVFYFQTDVKMSKIY